MKKRRKIKKKVLVLIVLVIVLILSITGIIIYKTFSSKPDNSAKVVDKIPEYGYTLEADQPKIYKELFKELSEVLSKDPVDEEKYATLETQIFISEFFTLSNKVNRSDVGGIQFVYKDYQESFTKLAMEGMYHYVENNIYGDRKQELPEVVNVDVINTEQKEYILSDDVTDEKAYYVDVTINYAKDLGYQQSATVVLIHNGKRLDIVKMTEK